MKTFPIFKESPPSTPFAFEIQNAYISLATISVILAEIPGVRDLQRRKLFGVQDDVHISFNYMGQACIVMEPFGDNSRYWIGPREPTAGGIDLSEIERHFQEYQLPYFRRLLGDILSFRIPGLAGGEK